MPKINSYYDVGDVVSYADNFNSHSVPRLKYDRITGVRKTKEGISYSMLNDDTVRTPNGYEHIWIKEEDIKGYYKEAQRVEGVAL